MRDTVERADNAGPGVAAPSPAPSRAIAGPGAAAADRRGPSRFIDWLGLLAPPAIASPPMRSALMTAGVDGIAPGTRLVLAPDTRRPRPGLVCGGSPWRVLRLTAAGDRWIDRWSVGEAVPDRAGARQLATRLVDAGLAWSRPAPDHDISVHVVVPTRDRVVGLSSTLAALDAEVDTTVVDDGSTPAAATAQVVAGRPRTRLVRRPRSGGPAAARNDGWHLTAGAEIPDPGSGPGAAPDSGRHRDGHSGATDPGRPRSGHSGATDQTAPDQTAPDQTAPDQTAPDQTAPDQTAPDHTEPDRAEVGGTELVAFVDADCIPPPGWLGDLAGHFGDPSVGAVAPRIRACGPAGGRRWLQAYEVVRSPLDMGRQPATVRPRSKVPYVPTAALVVRRAALIDIDGFDEGLVTGEDVDLVWRLARSGWRVRYDPSVVVAHPVRPTLEGWVRQRAGYGRSAAPLASRHGRAVAPLSISRWSAVAWVLTGLGHPLAGAAVIAAWSVRLARQTSPQSTASSRIARSPSGIAEVAATKAPGAATKAQVTATGAQGAPTAGRRAAAGADVAAARADVAAAGADVAPAGGDARPAPELPFGEIIYLTARSHLVAGRNLADAIRRAWWPPAVLSALAIRRLRPALAAVVIVAPLVEWQQRRPALGRAAWVALRLADDVAYGAGVWAGVLRERRIRCLLADL